MKKNVLYITQWKHPWLSEIAAVYSQVFDLHFLIDPCLSKNQGEFEEHVFRLNNLFHNYEIIFYHYEFAWDSLGKIFCHIDHPRKVAIFYDDGPFHKKNMECLGEMRNTKILSASPLSVLQYRTAGFAAYFMPLEGSYNRYPGLESEKIIDVSFAGSDIRDRKVYLDFLRCHAPPHWRLKIHLGDRVSPADYLFLLRSSKIVLNFSKASEKAHFYQFKGRVFESGFTRSLCLSEYCPEAELIFPNGAMPFFNSPKEMVLTLRALLREESLLYEKTKSFTECCEKYRPERLLRCLTQAGQI